MIDCRNVGGVPAALDTRREALQGWMSALWVTTLFGLGAIINCATARLEESIQEIE